MNFTAALIDLDEFLINSEELYLEANRLYFKKFDFDFSEKLHRQGTGKKFAEWITTVVPKSVNKTGEEILKERNLIFFELVKEKLKLLPGAKDLLQLLRDNFKTAMVTSSKKDYVSLVFDRTHVDSYFDLIITGEMVKKGKPDPECYLLAAAKLKVKTEQCLVFEDAPTGILAGKRAGMKVLAIPSQFVIYDKTFKKADLVLKRLKDVTFNTINQLDKVKEMRVF